MTTPQPPFCDRLTIKGRHFDQESELLVFLRKNANLTRKFDQQMTTPRRQVRHAGDSDDRSALACLNPGRRPHGLTPRSYQAKVDLCRLWDLMNQGRSQAEIARIMRKDPAWVSRRIRTIQSDFSTVYQRPQEKEMADDHLARLESLYSKAMRIAEDGEGMAQAAAVRTAAAILRDKMQFLQFVGLVERNQENPPLNQLLRFGNF